MRRECVARSVSRDRGAVEQVQWTCESGERRELKRAANRMFRALPTLSLGNPAHAAKLLAPVINRCSVICMTPRLRLVSARVVGNTVMSAFPATTVSVTGIEPFTESKVRITVEMIVDVNRLAEVSSELLRATVKRPQKKK